MPHRHDEDHDKPQQSQSSHGNLGLAGALAVQQQHCPHKRDEGNAGPILPARELHQLSQRLQRAADLTLLWLAMSYMPSLEH